MIFRVIIHLQGTILSNPKNLNWEKFSTKSLVSAIIPMIVHYWQLQTAKRKFSRSILLNKGSGIIGPDQDIEDIVNMETALYLLSSKGLIYEVPLNSGNDTSLVRPYPFFSTGKNDFETMYYDKDANGLIILCKSCESDKGFQKRSAYRFDLQSKQFDTTAYYSISTNEVKAMLKDEDAKFDPSAGRIHPLNNKLYILSSAGQLLVIADKNGKPLEAFKLNPDDHPQAEGSAFAPNGDMYITNEGKYGSPTLQVFRYQQAKKK